MIAVVAVVALALSGRVDAAPVVAIPVRALPRPDVPWVVAVLAVDVATLAATAPPALVDAGGTLVVLLRDDGALVVVEGPPEAHDLVVAAARAAVPMGARAAALFVEGRTTLVNSGAVPASARSRPALVPWGRPALAATTSSRRPLALQPSPALLGVEGAALELFVDDAVPAADAHVEVWRNRAVLVVTASDLSATKAVLAAAVDKPLPPGAVDALRARALGRIAERRSRVGAWAQDMAVRFLAFGDGDGDDSGDLGVHVRARIVPEALH